MSQASTSTLGLGDGPSQGLSFSETPSPPRPILISDKAVLDWQRSTGYRAFWGWIIRRCERIKGREIMYGESDHSAINSWLMLIDSMIRWIREIPPYPQSNQRFGNLAFREYIKLVETRLADLIASFPSISPALVSQLLPLLIDSTAFGQPTRLDYGTGHELAFVLGLWCCVVSGFVDGEEVEDELVLRVFPRYLDLVTLLQQTYKLEPAGSHGVWGLDDYCFFPYLFGSAQLLDSQTTPKQALATAQKTNPENIKDLYTLSLSRITLFKKGASFSEHSPLLYQLSSFPNWTKPHMGLRKMFSGEVSGKRVVVQGIWVGGWVWGEDLPVESGIDSGPGRRAGRGLGGGGSGVEDGDAVQMTPAPWKVDSRMKTLEATKGDWGGGMLSQRR